MVNVLSYFKVKSGYGWLHQGTIPRPNLCPFLGPASVSCRWQWTTNEGFLNRG